MQILMGKNQYKVDVRKDITALYRVKEAAEKAKKELSTSQSTNINLPYLMQVKGEPVHLDLTLTRTKFRLGLKSTQNQKNT